MRAKEEKQTKNAAHYRWLTPPEIANQLGVDASKVLNWIRRGELRGVNVADFAASRPRYRIAPQALDAFLRGREVKPDPPIARRRRLSRNITSYF